MVLQTTIDNLKTRPRHERRAVARGIAMLVAAVLFIGWVILFFKDIRENGIQIEPIQTPALNSASVTDAGTRVTDSFTGIKNTIQSIQNTGASQYADDTPFAVPAQTTY